MMALPFQPVAYPFFRGKRQSTRIYGYSYGLFTRTRTLKRCILTSLLSFVYTVYEIQQNMLSNIAPYVRMLNTWGRGVGG